MEAALVMCAAGRIEHRTEREYQKLNSEDMISGVTQWADLERAELDPEGRGFVQVNSSHRG